MVKLKDIAIKCNTSTATVSKALHDSPELSQATIDTIKKVAKEMGYVPNFYAMALKSKKTYNIGIVYYDATLYGSLRHEYFSSILEAIKQTAEAAGYCITFLSRNSKMSYLELAKYRNMDGVIVVTEDFNNPQVIELVNSTIPTVTIDYIFSSATAIMSDNIEGEEKLVDYVAAMGHKRIAFIHGENTDVTRKRLSGFSQGIIKNGIEIRPEYIIEGIFHDPKASGRATKALLQLDPRPTCIFYPDDISLFGGITALNQYGLKIPDDISVVGYDGASITRVYRPTITTYVQNSDELGKQAAECLINQIDDHYFPITPHYVTGHVQEGETVKKIN